MKTSVRWLAGIAVTAGAVLALTLLSGSMQRRSILAERTNLLAAAQRYPNFTLAQRMAVISERQSEAHPKWRDLSFSEIARLLLALATPSSAPSQIPLAQFFGNLTTINAPPADVIGLERQANCSLTMGWVGFNASLPTISYSVQGTVSNYDQVLHNAAGLQTPGGHFPAGCGDPVLGITSRAAVPIGVTTSNLQVGAGAGYNSLTGEQQIYTLAGNSLNGSNVSIGYITGINPVAVVAGDLNADGNGDLVAVNDAVTTGGPASISVLLGNANGSFQPTVSYALPGDQGISAVIDDVNGDGIPDIIASSSGTGVYALTFFAGKGDGTFKTPQSVDLTPPSGVIGVPYFGLITADLRGNGKKDLVTAAGIVLLGNGDGTFTQSTTLAFPSQYASSEFGPNVVAADFNKDGKIDLAADNGQLIAIYLGNGDGTFTAGASYATIDNTGYLTATDLDGDGNVDLFSGLGKSGIFGGDQFEIGQAYALMGNGDGTFRGAPELPFAFTGTNLVNLNGDSVPDGVGVNAAVNSNVVSFSSYLGNANGTFTLKATLPVSPITLQGNPYSFTSINSFAFGDVNGDGKTDLIYFPEQLSAPGGQTGYFLALGNGDGTFGVPVFIAAPSFVPAGDFDYGEQLTNVFMADVNGDGKADLIYNYYDEAYNAHNYYEGIAVQLSNGNGTFQAPKVIQTYSNTNAPSELGPPVIQVGEATQNKIPDLFVLIAAHLELYLGNGDGTFGTPSMPPVADNLNAASFGAAVGQIVLADMNGDGRPDLVTLGTTNDGGQAELAISLGNGSGGFAAPTILDFGDGGSLGYGLAVADFNGDGKLDVAVTGFNPPFDTGIFLGNGDGTVQAFNPGNGITEPAQAIDLVVYGPSEAVDFGASSTPDLVAGSAVLLNGGAGAPSLIPTTTTLTATPTTVTVGGNVAFSATVTASSGNVTPTGTVTFSSGSTQLGSGTLNGSGVATYSTGSLAVGTHSITAAYGGSTTFAASTSSPASVAVNAVPADFGISLSPSSGSVAPGVAATSTITITPSGGFNSQVSFACSGLPANSSCGAAAVTPNGTSAATSTLTVNTDVPSTALLQKTLPGQRGGSLASFALLSGGGLFGLAFFRRRRKGPMAGGQHLWVLALFCCLLGAIAGCGGGSSSNSSGNSGGSGGSTQNTTPAGTYPITVTATAGSDSHTTTYSLTVQ